MRNSSTTKFKKRIAITDEHYYWILENKKKKSAAGFLEQIINEFKKPNLFKKKSI